MPNKSNWEMRQHLKYYQAVRDILTELGARYSIIDVGSWDTPVVTWGDFKYRMQIDKKPCRVEYKGVDYVQKDWLKAVVSADVITCLQVIEHVERPDVFLNKILLSCNIAIVSLPFQWEAGACKAHLHDPINLAVIEEWSGAHTFEFQIIKDGGAERIVLYYDNFSQA